MAVVKNYSTINVHFNNLRGIEIMLPVDVVKKTIEALQSGDIDTTGIYLSSDFTCKGMAGQVLDKVQFMKLMDALLSAIPNWSYNAVDFEERGNIVRMKTHVTGKNTRPLNLHFLRIEPVAQKGIRVHLPEEIVEFSVKENKIVSMRVYSKSNSAIDTLLEQLGAEVRQMVSA
jgi:hypothetical protein